MKLTLSWTLTVALVLGAVACDVETGIPAAMRSGVLVAKIDSIGEFDVNAGVIEKMRKVGQEADNKWILFVDGARKACGDKDPAGFAVEGVSLELIESESTIKDLSHVFSGPVMLQFRDEASGYRATFASTFAVSGKGPSVFNVVGDRDALTPMAASMVVGNFSVGFIAEAEDAPVEFDLSLRVPVSVRAYCPDAE